MRWPLCLAFSTTRQTLMIGNLPRSCCLALIILYYVLSNLIRRATGLAPRLAVYRVFLEMECASLMIVQSSGLVLEVGYYRKQSAPSRGRPPFLKTATPCG